MSNNSRRNGRRPGGSGPGGARPLPRPPGPGTADPLGMYQAPDVGYDEYVALRFTKREGPEDIPQIPIFYIDDREYTAPERVPAAVSVRVLRMARTHGWQHALYYLIEQCIGEKELDDLAAAADMEQIGIVLTQLRLMYFGQIEAMTNPGN